MLRTRLTHPEILRALGEAGHGSTVLISDGNFPHRTATNPDATRVYLNLSPGRCLVTEVVEVLVGAIPIESATLMGPDEEVTLATHDEIRARLPSGVAVDQLTRFDFYAATRRSDLALVIATGDQRLFANVLVTIGVVRANPDASEAAT